MEHKDKPIVYTQTDLFSGEHDLYEEDAPSRNAKVSKNKIHVSSQYISSVWSFPGSGGDQLYRWYGTLPRALVERLVSLYAVPNNARILEPFMGLGTTLDVAADAGLHATGIDSNPLACLAASARLYGISSQEEVLSKTDKIAGQLMLAKHAADLSTEAYANLLSDAHFDYLRKWFRQDTLIAILTLLFEIAKINDERIQRLMFVAAAQVVRDVASVDPRCTHHLVTKNKPFIDPLPLWRKRISQTLDVVRAIPANPALVSVHQGSILNTSLSQGSADFVLMHPPYLGVIHYHLIHRLATDLLDIVNRVATPVALSGYEFDHKQLKCNDISTDHTETFKVAIKRLSSVMSQVVVPGGRCAVIIGDQRHKGNLRHPFTDFIYEFKKDGFILEENFIWVLQNNGGMHVLRRGHFIDHNYILIFHKEDHPEPK